MDEFFNPSDCHPVCCTIVSIQSVTVFQIVDILIVKISFLSFFRQERQEEIKLTNSSEYPQTSHDPPPNVPDTKDLF